MTVKGGSSDCFLGREEVRGAVLNRARDKFNHRGSGCCSETVASVTFSLWENMSVSVGSCYSVAEGPDTPLTGTVHSGRGSWLCSRRSPVWPLPKQPLSVAV